jgi:hypothetical protein
VTSGEASGDPGIAVAIAEAYLDILSGGSHEQLQPCLGHPAEQLLMGEDGRPYLVTAVGVQCPSGRLYLHVGVSNHGWDPCAPVVRWAVITFGAGTCQHGGSQPA